MVRFILENECLINFLSFLTEKLYRWFIAHPHHIESLVKFMFDLEVEAQRIESSATSFKTPTSTPKSGPQDEMQTHLDQGRFAGLRTITMICWSLENLVQFLAIQMKENSTSNSVYLKALSSVC